LKQPRSLMTELQLSI